MVAFFKYIFFSSGFVLTLMFHAGASRASRAEPWHALLWVLAVAPKTQKTALSALDMGSEPEALEGDTLVF